MLLWRSAILSAARNSCLGWIWSTTRQLAGESNLWYFGSTISNQLGTINVQAFKSQAKNLAGQSNWAWTDFMLVLKLVEMSRRVRKKTMHRNDKVFGDQFNEDILHRLEHIDKGKSYFSDNTKIIHNTFMTWHYVWHFSAIVTPCIYIQ